MTHEPMNTAPRDGREVWLMLKSGGQLVKCRWTKHEEYPLESWVSVDEQLDGEYEDDQVSGWLDIEALVRDSARLDWLLPILSLAEGPTDERAIRLAGALMLNMSGRAAIDAAIDK